MRKGRWEILCCEQGEHPWQASVTTKGKPTLHERIGEVLTARTHPWKASTCGNANSFEGRNPELRIPQKGPPNWKQLSRKLIFVDSITKAHRGHLDLWSKRACHISSWQQNLGELSTCYWFWNHEWCKTESIRECSSTVSESCWGQATCTKVGVSEKRSWGITGKLWIGNKIARYPRILKMTEPWGVTEESCKHQVESMQERLRATVSRDGATGFT